MFGHELKMKEKEYFALRLMKWGEDKNFQEAEQTYNEEMYSVDKVQKQISICIVVKPREKTIARVVESIFRQKYENYKIIISDQDGNLQEI